MYVVQEEICLPQKETKRKKKRKTTSQSLKLSIHELTLYHLFGFFPPPQDHLGYQSFSWNMEKKQAKINMKSTRTYFQFTHHKYIC